MGERRPSACRTKRALELLARLLIGIEFPRNLHVTYSTSEVSPAHSPQPLANFEDRECERHRRRRLDRSRQPLDDRDPANSVSLTRHPQRCPALYRTSPCNITNGSPSDVEQNQIFHPGRRQGRPVSDCGRRRARVHYPPSQESMSLHNLVELKEERGLCSLSNE